MSMIFFKANGKDLALATFPLALSVTVTADFPGIVPPLLLLLLSSERNRGDLTDGTGRGWKQQTRVALRFSAARLHGCTLLSGLFVNINASGRENNTTTNRPVLLAHRARSLDTRGSHAPPTRGIVEADWLGGLPVCACGTVVVEWVRG